MDLDMLNSVSRLAKLVCAIACSCIDKKIQHQFTPCRLY